MKMTKTPRRPMRKSALPKKNGSAALRKTILSCGVSVGSSSKWAHLAVESVVLGIRDLLYVVGYKCRSAERQNSSVAHIVRLFANQTDKEVLAGIKYLTAVALPLLDGIELPPLPDHMTGDEILFTGEWGRYVRPRMKPRRNGSYSATGRYLALSLLQLKRRVPPLPQSLVLEAAKKHRATLSRRKDAPFDLLVSIRRTVDEIFPIGWDKSYGKAGYTLSNKACFESTRARGGRQEYAFRYTSDVDDVTPSMRLAPSELDSMMAGSYGNVEVRRHFGAISRDEFERLAKENYDGDVCAAVEFVEDPAKIRPVTKDNFELGMLKPLQKVMHTHLRGFDQFSLIGEQVTAEHMEVFRRQEGEFFISGDYAAATDNLYMNASTTCLGAILANMRSDWACDPVLQVMARDSMKNVEIHYPTKLGLEPFRQTCGQLMGSLLSFIVLCVLNYAMWAECVSRRSGSYPQVSRDGGWNDNNRVLINGDDIAFCCDAKFYKTWWGLVQEIGFQPSLGKNYASKRFIMINSQCFVYENGKPKQSFWLNQGLLLPLGETKTSKAMNDALATESDATPLESLGKMHDDFVSAIPRHKELGSRIFIHCHQAELKETFRNLFGPVNLGGLGATPVSGSAQENEKTFNYRQLAIARMLSENEVSLPSYTQLPQNVQVARKLVSARVGPVVQVWDTPENREMHGEEDVSELISELSVNARSRLSWLAPYGLSGSPSRDFTFVSQAIKRFGRTAMVWSDYLNAPRKCFTIRDPRITSY